MTGSGKTMFATRGLLEYLRRQYPHAHRYVVDSTADPNILNNVIAPHHFVGDFVPPLSRDPTFTHVWTPDTDRKDNYEEFLEGILYARQPAIVEINEVASLKDLPAYIKLLKQGRKHGITVISETQSMAHVPSDIFNQMTHFVALRIANSVYETSTALRYLDMLKEHYHQPSSQHGLWYRRVDGPYQAKEYSGMQHFFKNSFENSLPTRRTT